MPAPRDLDFGRVGAAIKSTRILHREQFRMQGPPVEVENKFGNFGTRSKHGKFPGIGFRQRNFYQPWRGRSQRPSPTSLTQSTARLSTDALDDRHLRMTGRTKRYSKQKRPEVQTRKTGLSGEGPIPGGRVTSQIRFACHCPGLRALTGGVKICVFRDGERVLRFIFFPRVGRID